MYTLLTVTLLLIPLLKKTIDKYGSVGQVAEEKVEGGGKARGRRTVAE